MKRYVIIIAIAAMLGFSISSFAQGGLTPPGAPTETMKTLEQVEPRIDLATVTGDKFYHHIILEPGSYYLSGNLTVTKESGIWIGASGVTLELNGFEISRTPSGGEGIHIDDSLDRISVQNGSITGFGYGIRCYNNPVPATGCLFKELAVSACTAYGIDGGDAARIIDCCVHNNSGIGIYAGMGSQLRGCTSDANSGNGIQVDSGCSLNGCTAGSNSADGIHTEAGTTLADCSSQSNSGHGIYTAEGCSLKGCTAYTNESSG
ncbi:MAG: right-handed parallel beta-helix repeat-containing protein, partial [Kiritimatiellales bacterium]|nr:right-handed parallel beta-helix repeat-containing protein [Kiritimatiellales bacterium]